MGFSNSLGVDDNDECEEEDEEWVRVLEVDVPHLEGHLQVTDRREQTPELKCHQVLS